MEVLLLWQNVSAPYFACKLLMEGHKFNPFDRADLLQLR